MVRPFQISKPIPSSDSGTAIGSGSGNDSTAGSLTSGSVNSLDWLTPLSR